MENIEDCKAILTRVRPSVVTVCQVDLTSHALNHKTADHCGQCQSLWTWPKIFSIPLYLSRKLWPENQFQCNVENFPFFFSKALRYNLLIRHKSIEDLLFLNKSVTRKVFPLLPRLIESSNIHSPGGKELENWYFGTFCNWNVETGWFNVWKGLSLHIMLVILYR